MLINQSSTADTTEDEITLVILMSFQIQLSNVSVKAGGNTSNISSVEYVFFMEKEMLLLYSNNTRPDKIPDNKYDRKYNM